jgi:hypothetical protein
VIDWATAASLATAGGNLTLATATFASHESANKSARTAERAAKIIWLEWMDKPCR